LCKKIKATHKIRYLNVIHRQVDVNILYDNTTILIEFNKVFKTTNNNYFNYLRLQPNIKTIKDVDDFNTYKGYLNMDNIYMNFIYLNVANGNKHLLKNFLYLLINLLVIKETFEDIIYSNENFNYKWSIYCHIKLSNEMTTKRVNICMSQFLVEEFYTTPTFYMFCMYFTRGQYF